MKTKYFEEIRGNELVRKRLAKFMAQQCFRNTKLEDLHAGEFPASEAGDYSDVKVISPHGEIPWGRLSRLNNDEMKSLMIDVVNHCDQFLSMLFITSAGEKIIEELKQRDAVPNWNDPE